jgi:Ca2+-binding EF-hand superfamily protein
MGTGKYVISSKNEIILRTPRSGLKKTSRVSSLSKIITNPMAKMMMKEADKDGDGRVSFDEFTEMAFDGLSINERPWNWDFKMAYDKISKKFDLPSDNSPISFEDFSVYTDSEDRTNFDEIDVDNDGFITKEQFVDYFWELGKSELIELRMEFDKCDVDGDGYLSLEELSTFISSSDQEEWAEKKTNNWWSE